MNISSMTPMAMPRHAVPARAGAAPSRTAQREGGWGSNLGKRAAVLGTLALTSLTGCSTAGERAADQAERQMGANVSQVAGEVTHQNLRDLTPLQLMERCVEAVQTQASTPFSQLGVTLEAASDKQTRYALTRGQTAWNQGNHADALGHYALGHCSNNLAAHPWPPAPITEQGVEQDNSINPTSPSVAYFDFSGTYPNELQQVEDLAKSFVSLLP